MMSIELVSLLVLAITLVGGIASYYYGEDKYGKGILDGIQMHNSGRLTYTTYMEDGQEMLKIDIKEEEYEE